MFQPKELQPQNTISTPCYWECSGAYTNIWSKELLVTAGFWAEYLGV
jgi:hypothetical protein